MYLLEIYYLIRFCFFLVIYLLKTTPFARQILDQGFGSKHFGDHPSFWHSLSGAQAVASAVAFLNRLRGRFDFQMRVSQIIACVMVKGELHRYWWIHIHCCKNMFSSISMYVFDLLFDRTHGKYLPCLQFFDSCQLEMSTRFLHWNTVSKSLTSGTLLAISGAHLRTGDLDATW